MKNAPDKVIKFMIIQPRGTWASLLQNPLTTLHMITPIVLAVASTFIIHNKATLLYAQIHFK